MHITFTLCLYDICDIYDLPYIDVSLLIKFENKEDSF